MAYPSCGRRVGHGWCACALFGIRGVVDAVGRQTCRAGRGWRRDGAGACLYRFPYSADMGLPGISAVDRRADRASGDWRRRRCGSLDQYRRLHVPAVGADQDRRPAGACALFRQPAPRQDAVDPDLSATAGDDYCAVHSCGGAARSRHRAGAGAGIADAAVRRRASLALYPCLLHRAGGCGARVVVTASPSRRSRSGRAACSGKAS